MATLSGQPSPCFPAEDGLVGIGARRKHVCRSEEPTCSNRLDYMPNASSMNHSDREDSTIGSLPKYPNSGFSHGKSFTEPRRIRKHVYDEIKVTEESGDVRVHIVDNEQIHTLTNTSNSLPSNRKTFARTKKPDIPPKPNKFNLPDKRKRHVYHKIELPNERKPVPPPPPPPLPSKPVSLVKLRDETPPPLPPRVANREAMKLRHKLDKEYFENLRKSVDENLLEIAEEGDLPVPIPNENEITTSNQEVIRVGSPESTITSHPVLATLVEPNRRHSMPLRDPPNVQNQATDSNNTGRRPPMLPPRSLSLEDEREISEALNVSESMDTSSKSKESPRVLLARNLLLLKNCGWYWGNMTWQEAEALLTGRGEGSFLMRDSQNPLHLLTVTVVSSINTIHHIRVEYMEGKFQLYEPGRTVSRSAEQCVRHSNIEQFIKLAMKHSMSGSFLYFVKPKNMGEPPIQIRLLTPVSRLTKVKSLQYLCRMVVRNCLVADLIPSLKVPSQIQVYLMAGPYYDASESL